MVFVVSNVDVVWHYNQFTFEIGMDPSTVNLSSQFPRGLWTLKSHVTKDHILKSTDDLQGLPKPVPSVLRNSHPCVQVNIKVLPSFDFSWRKRTYHQVGW